MHSTSHPDSPEFAISARLRGYFTFISEEGPPSAEFFVARGALLMDATTQASLFGQLPAIREKIGEIRRDAPRLALQAEMLVFFFVAAWQAMGDTSLPEFQRARDEAAFALAYTAAGSDLIPDDLPNVGFLDDAAVIETVLSRNAQVLRNFAHEVGLAWEELEPDPASTRRRGEGLFAVVVHS